MGRREVHRAVPGAEGIRLDTDGLVITKYGKPVARVVPYDRRDADLIGSLRHKIEVRGDIFTTGARWNADAES